MIIRSQFGQLTVCALLMAGCAVPNVKTPNDLRTAAEGVVAFENPRPVEDLYRLLLTRARACFERGGHLTVHVTGEQYPGKGAEISIAMSSTMHYVLKLHADLMPIRSGTSVRIYYIYRHFAHEAEVFKTWATAGTQDCPEAPPRSTYY